MTTSIKRFCICAGLLSAVAFAQLNFVPLTIHVQRADGSAISGAKVDIKQGSYGSSGPAPRGGYHLSGITDEHGDYHFTGSIQDNHRIEVMAKGFSTTLCDKFLLEAMRMMVVTMKQTSAPSTSPACVNSDPPAKQQGDN